MTVSLRPGHGDKYPWGRQLKRSNRLGNRKRVLNVGRITRTGRGRRDELKSKVSGSEAR